MEADKRSRRQGKYEQVPFLLTDHNGEQFERLELYAQAHRHEDNEAERQVRKLMRLAPLTSGETRQLNFLMYGGSVSDYARAAGVSRQRAHQQYQSAIARLRVVAQKSAPDKPTDYTPDALFALGSRVTLYTR
jgi:hypothetical protein